VEIDPNRLAQTGVTVADVRQALQSANAGAPVGDLLSGDRAVQLEAGPFLREAREVGELLVAVRQGKPVALQDVARVVDGPLPPVCWARASPGNCRAAAAVAAAAEN